MTQKKHKNILFVTTQFETVVSGPGRFSNYLNQLDFDGKITLYFLTDDIKTNNNTNTYKVPTIPLLNKIPGYWLLRYILFGFYIFKISSKKNFDFIIGNSAYELLFLFFKRKNTTYIAMLNDYNYCEAIQNFNTKYIVKSLSRFLGYFIEKIVISKVDIILVNSMYMKTHLSKFYKRLDTKKVIVFYKGVDLSKFRMKTNFTPKLNNFLFVKNDWKRGGLESIIKGFSKLNWQDEIVLTIAGIQNNKDKSEILTLFSKYNSTFKIQLFGLLNQNEIISLYNSNDIYIMLSKSEALGVSLMEAMSSGLPIISTNVGGIPEVLDYGQAGFMLEYTDQIDVDLSILLKELKQKPELLIEKRNYGLDHVKKFDINNLKTNFINVTNEN